MIVGKANVPKRLKWFVRKKSLETGCLISIIVQRAMNLSKTMVGAIERCKWNEFWWNGTEMRSMEFVNFLRECVFTFIRGTFEPAKNAPRASTGKFKFPNPDMFSTRLDHAPGKDVVTWYKEFGIWAE